MTPEEIKQLVEEHRASKRSKTFRHAEKSGGAAAWGHVADLLSGVAVGVLLGYWLDQWLGTKPIMLISCIMFGSAAGFMMVIRGSKSDTSTPVLEQEEETNAKK